MNTAENGSYYRPIQKRAMTSFTKESCGRGGEVKFQNYSVWKYKNYFKILDRQWFEMKKLENYSSGMAPQIFILLWNHFTPLIFLGM